MVFPWNTGNFYSASQCIDSQRNFAGNLNAYDKFMHGMKIRFFRVYEMEREKSESVLLT